MNGTDITWEHILPEPFVLLELGARGEGKTALGHRLLEVFESDERDAYIMGFPEDKRHLLPDWLEVLPTGIGRERWPEDSIVLIHEAHQTLHARRSMDAENLELDELVTVSRHKNSDIIYDTQQSQRLDKNAVAAVDGICVRWPALMQEDFERRAVRPIIEDARDALSKYVTIVDEDEYTFVKREETDDGVDKLKKHVYVHADQFRGEYPHEVSLADHWTEEISKAYGESDGGTDGHGQGYNSLEEVRDDMADIEDVGEKDTEEVESIIEEAGVEVAEQVADDTPTDDGGGDSGASREAGGKAQELIRKLKERDNRVISNDYPKPIVEVIVPTALEEDVYELVQSHRELPGDEKRAVPVPPSTQEAYPEASEALTGFQFLLDEMNAGDLRSSGYNVHDIFDALTDEPAIATKNAMVEAELPWE